MNADVASSDKEDHDTDDSDDEALQDALARSAEPLPGKRSGYVWKKPAGEKDKKTAKKAVAKPKPKPPTLRRESPLCGAVRPHDG